MSYSEQLFRSKKGNECLLIDLKSYYEGLDETQVSKPTEKDYICECPICAEEQHYKHKLYIEKGFNVGHCFRCHTVLIDNTEHNDCSYYDNYENFEIPQLEDISKNTLVKLDGDKWNLELYESLGNVSKKGLDYLKSRKNSFLDKLYIPLGIRFLGCNPVIPFYFHNELIYYQIKLIDGDIKYFSPPIKKKPLYIIEKKSNPNRKFVICEGVFDAIACLILFPDRVPVALLGSTITTYQLWMLNSYAPADILIFMDETRLSQGVYYKIRSYLDYSKLSILESDGSDPEEYLYANLNKIVK